MPNPQSLNEAGRGTDTSGRTRSVAAVIVTHNSAKLIGDCLDALAQNLVSSPGLKVVIVDNGSVDDTLKRARAHALRPEVVIQENLGYAAGINTGIAASVNPGDHVLVLNPDVRLQEGAVARLIDAVERPGVGIAVPRMVDARGHLLPSLRREPTPLRAIGEALLGGGRAGQYPALGEMITDPDAYDRATVADWATGAAMLISAACRRAVGSWDDRYFLYSEEVDYALRARDLGFWLQLVPEARAIHLGGESAVSPRLSSLLMVNKIRLQRRRKGLLRTIPLALGVVLFAAVRAAAGTSTAKAALRALVRPTSFDQDLRLAMNRNRDYLLFAGFDWWDHNRAIPEFQLFRWIARTRNVLVVNRVGMRMVMPGRNVGILRCIQRNVAGAARLMRKPLKGIFGFNVVTPLFVPHHGHRLGRALNARFVALQVRIAAGVAGISNPIVVASSPTAVDFIDRLPRRFLVYNRSDQHDEFGEEDWGVIRSLEERLLRESDLVVYASSALMEEDRSLAGGRQLYLDHGVDLDHFDPARYRTEPHDMRDIPHPRVGFIGDLDDYLDFELIKATARTLTHAQFVLIGDKYCADEEIEQLIAMPNLTWLGFRPYEEIPAFGAAFDVAIMPGLDNAWIHGANSVKIKEYLALGLPVVSIDSPEVAPYADVVSVASGDDEFIRLVAAALKEGGPGTPALRRAAVAHLCWGDRAQALMVAVESLGEP